VTMQEKVTKRKTLMMDAKNLEVERAVEDLINVVLSFPMEDFGSASISDETVQKLRDHYSRLMYLAILNTTKNSFHTLKKRLTARTSTGGVVYADKPFFDVNVELSLPHVTMNPSSRRFSRPSTGAPSTFCAAPRGSASGGRTASRTFQSSRPSTR
jgi:dynein heavy chain